MSSVAETARTAERPETTGWRHDALTAAGYLGSAALGGLLVGFVIGGIGSRLAMMLLRFTAGDSVVGLTSDDGFEIGRLSGASVFLLLFATAIGVAGSVVYLLTRVWFPPRLRVVLFGVFGAVFGGGVILHADGIDFRLLTPVWLAVVLFIALPGLGAAAIALLVERLLRRNEEAGRRRAWASFLPLLGFAAIGPIGLAVVGAAIVGVATNGKVHWADLWTSPAVTWIGRVVIALAGGKAAMGLAQDLQGIF